MNAGAKSLDTVLSPSTELRSLIEPSRVFSSISRLNASTPLSTPSARGAVDEEDNGIVLARNGLSVADVGGKLGSEYCSCDNCDEVVVVRSGTRAIALSASVRKRHYLERISSTCLSVSRSASVRSNGSWHRYVPPQRTRPPPSQALSLQPSRQPRLQVKYLLSNAMRNAIERCQEF